MEIIWDGGTDPRECARVLGQRINALLGSSPENTKMFGPICNAAGLDVVEFAKIVEGVTAADVPVYGIIFGVLGYGLKILRD
jgi:hypothetical protein